MRLFERSLCRCPFVPAPPGYPSKTQSAHRASELQAGHFGLQIPLIRWLEPAFSGPAALGRRPSVRGAESEQCGPGPAPAASGEVTKG